jgi:uncharacterized membrane protein YkvA (DUF1232 family)
MGNNTVDSADTSMWNRLKSWARRMKRDTMALYLARKDPRVSRLAKVMAMATAAYALSPIDLIPDFIPVLGYLDELILLPLFIYLTIRLIPPDVMVELRARADQHLSENRPRNMTGAVVIVMIWLSIAIAIADWMIK